MKSAAIVGTGLIGTSVALALSRRGVTVHLSDADETAARTAAALGAGLLDRPDGPVDLAVLAVPPSHTAAELARGQHAGLAHAYTDVASVKVLPADEFSTAGGDSARYVGGHPLAGGERSGPLAGRADLFEGRYWVLTPSTRTEPDVLDRAVELVGLCGGVPVLMDSVAHDYAVALTSHTPHLVSTLMAALLENGEEDALKISGRGLLDITRIAAGDSVLWGEILGANAAVVADMLDLFSVDLARGIAALRALSSKDERRRAVGAADLDVLLRRGQRGQARVPRKPGAPQVEYASVSVVISDQPGALASLLATAGQAEVNIEDVSIEHSLDQPSGLVKLLVNRTFTDHLVELLRINGWDVLRDSPLPGQQFDPRCG
jgi:prephenate dehydrogenase